MLRYIFNRAKAMPWQPCALNIGEIEEIVLTKDSGSDKGGGSAEVTNYLLDSMDGNLKIDNCKIFGSTNYVTSIEKAILRRFNLYYLGLFDK